MEKFKTEDEKIIKTTTGRTFSDARLIEEKIYPKGEASYIKGSKAEGAKYVIDKDNKEPRLEISKGQFEHIHKEMEKNLHEKAVIEKLNNLFREKTEAFITVESDPSVGGGRFRVKIVESPEVTADDHIEHAYDHVHIKFLDEKDILEQKTEKTDIRIQSIVSIDTN